jgi:putative NADPH-quinone reductase
VTIKTPPGKGKKIREVQLNAENRQGKRRTKLHEPGHKVGNHHQDLEDFEPVMTPVDYSLVAGPVDAVRERRVGDALKQWVDRVWARIS